METRALLSALRAGQAPDHDALSGFAAGLADGTVSDAQAGAFAMAVCLNGLGDAGTVALTQAMRDSGDVLAWDLPGPVVDKHSTGGVGDPVSLILAPMLAALGCYVPMISGRGLGHSGGTLDKLESIPGVSTTVDEPGFRAIVGDTGCAIVSATGAIAPADKRLYAVRDVTGTVDSIDLITASILSKKLAGGIGTLVLDVKVGSGAFMPTAKAARALAQQLVATANGAGCATRALITDMNQPLAPAVGNAVEVAAVMAVLNGATDTPLAQVALKLGASVLTLAGQGARTADLAATLRDGRAAERFGRMIAALGGPVDFVENWETHLPTAPVIVDLPAPETGDIAAIDGVALGETVVRLGGGRMVESGRIDPAVGLSHIRRLGDRVTKGDTLLRIHAATSDSADAAARRLRRAITIGVPPTLPPLIHEEFA
ncbi:thymidine phosphorylase [Oceaniglobus ichthyenteri]|uniref:thymidine phosphorylase n=1 Tax=Oceaniglobus ichthyenteri TaxID=2136177 RepID=UPI000D3C26E1|nr:thymidine phosphorylase [Oceaniglobus ichthyenteri]